MNLYFTIDSFTEPLGIVYTGIMADLANSNPYGNPSPQGDNPQDDFLRQTEHRAMTQAAPAGVPEVSYEAEDYQPQPSLDSYQPPAASQAPVVNAAPAPTPAPAAVQTPPTPEPAATTQAPQAPPAPNSSTTNKDTSSTRFPGVEKPRLEEVVIEWESLSRPFKKRGRQYYTTGVVIMVLISMILFFAQQFLPIAVVIAVGFLAYVLSVVPPGMIKHSFTTYGIRMEDQLYYWDELGRFWFSEKYGQRILHVETNRFPWRLTILLGELTEAEVTEILSEVLIKQKPEQTAFERASEWLQAKIPLDNDPD